MRTAREQNALATVSDGLSRLPRVQFMGIRPHPHAQNSFLADVAVQDATARLELLSLSERVYLETGALVLFRAAPSQPASAAPQPGAKGR